MDACHALMNLGWTAANARPACPWKKRPCARRSGAAHLQAQVNDLWRTLPRQDEAVAEEEERRFPRRPRKTFSISSRSTPPA